MVFDITYCILNNNVGKYQIPNEFLELDENKLKGIYKECLICWKNEVSDNIECTKCKLKICCFCCNNLQSRNIKVAYDDASNIVDYHNEKSSSYLQYDCPNCQNKNQINYNILNQPELIILQFQDIIDKHKLIKKYNLIEENILHLYNKLQTNANIEKTFLDENEELRLKNNEKDIEIKFEKIKLKFIENQFNILQKKSRNIEKENQELRLILNNLITNHNTLFDETYQYIQNKKYKELKKIYR